MDKRAPSPVQARSQGPFPGDCGLGLSLSLSWDTNNMRIKLGYNHPSLPCVRRLHPGPRGARVTCCRESSASGAWGHWLSPLAQGRTGLSSGEGPMGLAWVSEWGGERNGGLGS